MWRLMLKPKYQLVQEHEERLRSRPDAAGAARRFDEMVALASRVALARAALFFLVYLGAIVALTITVIDLVQGFEGLRGVLLQLRNYSSLLTLIGLIGVLFCNRILVRADVELHYYSLERVQPRQPST